MSMRCIGLILACAFAIGASVGDDVATVRDAILRELLWSAGSPRASAAEASLWASTLDQSNGTWPDITYNDPNDRTNWKAAEHTSRVQALAAAVALPGGPLFRNESTFACARRALAGWLKLDPPNTNWWWIILQSPQTLSASYLLLSLVGDTTPAPAPAFPTPAELDAGLVFMYRAAWWNASLGYEVTGANLAWMIQVQLTRGVLPTAINETALTQGFERLWEEVKIVNDTNDDKNQGIQVDSAYHMHSAQLQVSSYGQDYLSEVLLWSTVAAGTVYALPASQSDILCNYVAAGMGWLTNGRSIDWAAAGRQIARPGAGQQMLVSVNLTRLTSLAGACSAPVTRAAVSAYVSRVRGDPSAPVLVGNKHFFTSDHMAHRRVGWAANLHMRSKRTTPPECGNSENTRGEHMGNGLLNLVGDGVDGLPGSGGVAEYADIFPILNWAELNGIISDVSIPVPDCANVAGCCWVGEVKNNLTAWVGGVSDGVYGAAVMNTSTHTLTARRAWFFLDRAVIALTADVHDFGAFPSADVRTTLASRRLWGAITTGFTNGTLATLNAPWGNGSLPLGGPDGVDWVQAVGHAWVPFLPLAGPAPPAVVLSAGRRFGTWESIGASFGAVSNDTLTLSLQHGSGAALQLARFGYALLPNTSAAGAPAAAAAVLAMAIINNGASDGGVQAVADPIARVALAAFWSPSGGTAALGGSWPITLSVTAPCLVTYRETTPAASAVLSISAPVPTPGTPSTTITVRDRTLIAGPDCPAVPAPGGGSAITATLPPLGDYQGSSVVYTCGLAIATH